MLKKMKNYCKTKTMYRLVKASSLFVFLLMIMPHFAWGQKVKSKYIKYNYVNLPVDRLSEDIKTYSVKINEVSSRYGNILGGEHIADTYLKLPGYERVDESGDIKINVRYISGLRPGEVKIQSKKVAAVKDKEGKIKTRAYTKYWYSVNYSTPSYAMTITTKDGESIIDDRFGGVTQSDSWGDNTTYKSSYTLQKDWNASREGYYGSKESNYLAVGAARGFIKKHCLTKSRGNERFQYIKKYKKHKYDDLNKAIDKMKVGLTACKEDRIGYTNKLLRTGYEAHATNVKEAISIWEKALGEHKKGEKKIRINAKVAEVLYYNLAKANALIYDFDAANKYMKMAVENKSKGKKYLEKSIKKWNTAYDANTWRGDDLASVPGEDEINSHGAPGGAEEEESEEAYYDDDEEEEGDEEEGGK